MSDSTAAIEIQNLEFSYRTGQPILEIAQLRVGRGERLFLFGPSGSGKTTLLGILAGILDVSRGSVQLLGRDFHQLGGKRRDHFRGSHIGYIFQMFNLIPYLSVIENIVLPCKISRARASRVAGDLDGAASALAEGLGIGDLLHKKVTDLSVGQQQRVAAARALIGAPEIIIADEPTSSLDTDHRELFLRLLFAQAEKSNSTVVFVSHDHALKSLFQRTVSLPEINARARRA